MAQVVVVVGASGGCGASTLAALLARRRAREGRTVLVDLDPGGPGIEVLLGAEAADGARWADLEHARGRLGTGDLDGVLPTWAGVEVLSEDRRAAATSAEVRRAVVDALVARADTVVLDTSARVVANLPDVATLVRGAATLLVCHQDVAGTAAALRTRTGLTGVHGAVLRRSRGSTVAAVEARHMLGVPVLARLGQDTTLRGAVERGLGPVPGRATGRAVARLDAALRAPGRRTLRTGVA